MILANILGPILDNFGANFFQNFNYYAPWVCTQKTIEKKKVLNPPRAFRGWGGGGLVTPTLSNFLKINFESLNILAWNFYSLYIYFIVITKHFSMKFLQFVHLLDCHHLSKYCHHMTTSLWCNDIIKKLTYFWGNPLPTFCHLHIL